MKLVDSHCHLTFDDFQPDLNAVLERAKGTGVVSLLVPGIDLETSRQAVSLAEQNEEIYAAVGVHPQDSPDFTAGALNEFRRMCKHEKVVAIGEIGLDYYRDYAPGNVQRDVFRRFVELAVEEGLPVIIHNRMAFEDVMTILSEINAGDSIKGVFHCFSEGYEEAERVMKLGFWVSFTGTITFRNSRSAELASRLPMDKMLLETDAPFMAPVPHRGKRNEPAYVREIAEKQAELHGLSLQDVAEITTSQVSKLFSRMRLD